jgi:hypothetical protein
MLSERLKLDLAVAEDVRVRSLAGGVIGEEAIEHALTILGREVCPMQRNFQFFADRACRLKILGRAAIALLILGPVDHEQCRDAIALFLQQPGGNR